MNKPIVNEFNVETQEEIVREMNDEEYAQYLIEFPVTPTEEI